MNLVECFDNYVYEDEDLYYLFKCLNIKVIGRVSDNFILYNNHCLYKVPCKDYINRFGEDLENETILDFGKIYY